MTSKKRRSSFVQFKGTLLGEIEFLPASFDRIDQVFREFYEADFRDLLVFEKHARVSKALYELICETDGPAFLLPYVVDYIAKVQQLLPTYHLTSFEFWLNQYSGLSPSENFRVRGKIAGKYLQREDYQQYFPIGLDKHHPGSHFVLAHFSPDIDTFVASYWGWVDAFAARVGEGLHYWLVPERLPENPIELQLLFKNIFGESVFQILLTLRRGIRLTALDLMTQEGIVKKTLDEKSYGMEHDRAAHAIVLVNDEGNYLGDWRSVDIDAVRGVTRQFGDYLRQMENLIHQKLISIFTKADLSRDDMRRHITQILHKRLTDSDVVESNPEHIDAFVKNVLKIESGYDSTLDQFMKAISNAGLEGFKRLYRCLTELPDEEIFDKEGKILENRPKIFSLLEKVVEELSNSFREFREYADTLGCAFEVKRSVFGFTPNYLSHFADLSEIQEQMKHYSYMTVNYREPTGVQSVMGAIFASSLQKNVLATASLRDFGNHDEADIPPYVMPISLLDHHRTEMSTSKAARFIVSDVQSCNVIVADLAMRVNDRYSSNGMDLASIEEYFQREIQKEATTSRLRVLQKLLQRKAAASTQRSYYVAVEREFIEYLHFVYAILDDTDFLTKVTLLDVECMASLINRLKSLSLGQEVEVVHFDDIPRDPHFVAHAAKRLQQNEDLYSLYKKVYTVKESLINEMMKELDPAIFQDTKVQNSSTAVGQFKIFRRNVETFQRQRKGIYNLWIERSEKMHKEKEEIDLHLLMLTTLTSAEELYHGQVGEYTHRDELCCWYPPDSKSGFNHLKSFLQEFLSLSSIRTMEIDVELHGKRSQEFRSLLEAIIRTPIRHIEEFPKEKNSFLILKVDPGSINSRKSKITPCLP